MRNFTLTLVSGLVIAGSANALTCINDYGGTSSCTNTNPAGDCETLGYSKDDVSGCDHYLYCPFDTSYKRCVTEGEQACTQGYARTTAGCNPLATVKPGTGGSIGVIPGGSIGGVSVGGVTATQNMSSENAASSNLASSAATTGTTLPGGIIGGDFGSIVTTFHETGWKLDANDKDDSGCYKCVERTCPSGTSTSNTCSGGKVAQATEAYAGNSMCYKCVSCPSGYATSVANCGSGNWMLDKKTAYAGCYKCVTNSCSTGYAKTVAECGTTGATGWTLGSTTDPMNAQCKLCVAKACDGYSASKQSVNDCTSNGHPEGWNFATCTSGDTIMGKCTAKTCNTTCSEVYKLVPQYTGDTYNTNCKECKSCVRNSPGDACKSMSGNSQCKCVKVNLPKHPDPTTYIYGKCSNKRDNWICESYSNPCATSDLNTGIAHNC